MLGPCLEAEVTDLSGDCRVTDTISRLDFLTFLTNLQNTRLSSITHFLFIIAKRSLLLTRINVTSVRSLN